MKSGKAIAPRRPDVVDPDAMVAAALDLLEESGPDGCTPAALALRTGVDGATIGALFTDQDSLNLAMAAHLAADVAAPMHGQGWQVRLAHRAGVAWSAMRARRNGSLLFARLPRLFPQDDPHLDCVASLCGAGFTATDAVMAQLLVDRFTIGAALAARARNERGDADPDPSFASQLNVLLAGIAASRTTGIAVNPEHRQSSFQHKVWVFLRDARESANIAFARTVHFNELDRRILLLLHAQGDMTLAAISLANGVDKAQVSRAIKRMTEVSLLNRTGIRNPIRLSQGGRQLAEKLQRQAELRNRELTFGISDEQLVDLFGVLDTLLNRAIVMFEQERKWSAASPGQQETVEFRDLVDEGLPDENGIPVDRSRILPPFVTLCSYMLRGSSLAHKRRTGLSNFESWVMAEICNSPPISWPQLIVALYRDQSQAGRTINHLVDIGLVERTGKPGRRHGFFAPTAEGRRISDIIADTAMKRSEFLFQGIPAQQLENFMAGFSILARNAEVQVARERAIQEMDRD